VRLHEFKGRWFDISEAEQTRLCSRDRPEGQHALGTSKRIRWTLTARRAQLPSANLAKGRGRLGKGSILMPSLSNANKQITITI